MNLFLTSCIVAAIIIQKRVARQQKKEQKKERVNQLIKCEEEGAIIYQKQSVFV